MDQINRKAPASTIGAAQNFQNTTQFFKAPLNTVLTDFFASSKNDIEDNKIKEDSLLQIRAGIDIPPQQDFAQVEEAPEYNMDLYSETIGITKYSSLRDKVGLKDDESFTDYYNNNKGYVPEGFEREAKMLLREEKVKGLEQKMLNKELSQTDFLYKAYGKDLLKAKGYDTSNPYFWYNRYRNGDYSDVADNYALMTEIYNASLAAYQQELWFRDSQMSLKNSLLGYVGTELKEENVREIFKEQFEAIDDVIGDGQKVIDMYRAGMLTDTFSPIIYDKNGKAIFYMHYDGKLYSVADAGTPGAGEGFLAKAHYYADGTLKKITVRNATGFGETFQNLTKGAVESLVGFVDLFAYAGGLIGDTVEGLTGQGWDLSNVADYSIWRNKTMNSISWLSTDYTTSSGWLDRDGNVDWQNVTNGVAYGVGLLGTLLLTGAVTGGAGGVGKLASSSADDIVKTFADDLLASFGDDAAVAAIKTKISAGTYTLDDFLRQAAQSKYLYLTDDYVKAATDLGLKNVTKEIIINQSNALGLKTLATQTLIRTNSTLLNQSLNWGQKGLNGTKWLIRSLTSIRNGAPTQNILKAGLSLQRETMKSLLPLAAREFLETGGALKARQEINGLKDSDIFGIALASAATNYAISFAMRGVLDTGVIDRHVNGLKKLLGKHAVTGKGVEKWVANSTANPKLVNFIKWIDSVKLKHPLGFARMQSFIDIAENVLTATNNSFVQGYTRTDEDGLKNAGYLETLGSMFNSPQFIATNLHMHFTNMRGNYWTRSKSESGYLYGEVVNGFQNVKVIVDDGRSDILRMIEIERTKNTDEGNRNAVTLSTVLKEIDVALANKDNDMITNHLTALGLLDNLTTRIDEVTGKETSPIREKLLENIKSERVKNARIQIQTIADQYNAMVSHTNNKMKQAWDGKLLKPVYEAYRNMVLAVGNKANFEAQFGKDSVGYEAAQMQMNETINMLNQIQRNYEVTGTEGSKLMNEVTNNISGKGLNVFAYKGNSKFQDVDGKLQIVDDAANQADIDRSESILRQNGLNKDQVIFIKIDEPEFLNAGTPSQAENKMGTALKQHFDILSKIKNTDEGATDTGILIKVADDLYVLPTTDLPNTILQQMNISQFIRLAYVFKYASSNELIENSARDLLRVIGGETPEVKELLKNWPEDETKVNEYLKSKPDIEKTYYNALEDLIVKFAINNDKVVSRDLLSKGLNIIPEIYLNKSNGLLGTYKRLNSILNKAAELQTKSSVYIKNNNLSIEDKEKFLSDFRILKNEFDNIQKDNPKNISVLTKEFSEEYGDLNSKFIALGKTLGEYSASQAADLLAEGLFNITKFDSSEELPDEIIGQTVRRIISLLSSQDDDTLKKLNRQVINKNFRNKIKRKVSSLSSKAQVNSEKIINNLEIFNYDQKTLIETIKRFVETEEDVKIITEIIWKIKKELFSRIYGDPKTSSYKKNIDNALKQLIENKIIEDKDYTSVTDEEVERIVIENYNLEDLRERQFDLQNILFEAVSLSRQLENGAVYIKNNFITINVKKFKGKLSGILIERLNNPTVMDQIEELENGTLNDIINIVYGGEASDNVRKRISDEIKISKEMFKNNDGIIQIKLNEDGSLPIFAIELLKKLGYANADKLKLDSNYKIPGITLSSNVLVDTIDFENDLTLDALIKTVYNLYKEENRKNTTIFKKVDKKNIQEFSANLENNLKEEVGGIEYVDDDTVINDVSLMLLSNVNPDNLTAKDLTSMLQYLTVMQTYKLGIAASISKGTINFATKGLGALIRNDSASNRLHAIYTIVETGYEILKDREKNPVRAALLTLSVDEAKELNDSGIYDVQIIGNNKYEVTVKGTADDYLINVAEYLNNNKNKVNTKVLFGISKLGGEAKRNEAYIKQSFFDKLYFNLNVDDDTSNEIFKLLNGTFDLSQTDFDLSKNKKASINNYFKGKTIKEIKTSISEFDNNLYFKLVKNNLLAAEVISKKIIDIFNNQKINSKLLLNNKARRAASISIIEYYEDIENGMLQSDALKKAYQSFINNYNTPRYQVTKPENVETYAFQQGFSSTNYREAFVYDDKYIQGVTEQDLKELIDTTKTAYDNAQYSEVSNDLDFLAYNNKYARLLEALSIGSQNYEPTKFLVGLSSNSILNMDDEEYEAFKDVIQNFAGSKSSLAKQLFEKYDSIRQNNIDIGNYRQIRLPATSEKNAGEVSDNKVQKVRNADVQKKLIDNQIARIARSNNEIEPFKLSELNIQSQDSDLNRFIGELMSRYYTDEVTAPASRFVHNFKNKKDTGLLINNVSRFAANLMSTLRGLDIKDPETFKNKVTSDKAIDAAWKIYLYTTGLDFSNQYAKYIIIDDQFNIQEDIGVMHSKGFGQYADLIKLVDKFKKLKAESSDKKYFLIELNKNMINEKVKYDSINGLKLLELNNDNANKVLTFVTQYALDEFSRSNNEETKRINRIQDPEQKFVEQVSFAINRNISKSEIEKLKINTLKEMVKINFPNKSDKELEQMVRIVLSSQRFSVSSSDNTLTEEAIWNSILSDNLNSKETNYIINLYNEISSYGFTNSMLPTEVKELLNENKKIILPKINKDLKQILLNVGIDKTNINQNLKRVMLAFDNVYNEYSNNENIIDARVAIINLKNTLNNFGINESNELRSGYLKQTVDLLLNYLLVKSNNPKTIIARMLDNPYNDLNKTYEEVDFSVLLKSTFKNLKLQDVDIDFNMNNALSKDFYVADAENAFFPRNSKEEQQNKFLTYQLTIIKQKGQEGKTKELSLERSKLFNNYLANPTTKNQKELLNNLNSETYNIFMPIYILKGGNYILIDNEDKLKQIFDIGEGISNYYQNYYLTNKAVRDSFDSYFKLMNKLVNNNEIQLNYKNINEVEKAIDQAITNQKIVLDLDDDSMIVGFNSIHDRKVLDAYKNLPTHNKIFNAITQESKWFDLYTNGLKEHNLDTVYKKRKLQDVADKMANELGFKVSIGDAHDSNFDTMATLFVYYNFLYKKINNINYSTQFKDDVDFINDILLPGQKHNPKLLNVLYAGDIKEFVSNPRYNTIEKMNQYIEALKSEYKNLKSKDNLTASELSQLRKINNDIKEIEKLKPVSKTKQKNAIKNFFNTMDELIDEYFIDEDSKDFIRAKRNSIKADPKTRDEINKLQALLKELQNYQLHNSEIGSLTRILDEYAEDESNLPINIKRNLDLMQSGNYKKTSSLLEYLIKNILYPNTSYKVIYENYLTPDVGAKRLIDDITFVLKTIDFNKLKNILGDNTLTQTGALDLLLKENNETIIYILKDIISLDKEYLTDLDKTNITNFKSKINDFDKDIDITKNATTFANILNKITDDANFIQQRNRNIELKTGFKFNNILNLFNNAFSSNDLNKEAKIYHEAKLRNLYNGIKNIVKDNSPTFRVFETWAPDDLLVKEFLSDPSQMLTIGREGLYKQASELSTGTKINVIVGADSNGKDIIKEEISDSETIYISKDVAKQFLNIKSGEGIGNDLDVFKLSLNLNKDDDLFIMASRHPHNMSENMPIIKIKVIESDNKQVVAIDKDAARSKFNLDFDGDNIVLYKTDQWITEQGKLLNKYTNKAFQIYDIIIKAVKNQDQKTKESAKQDSSLQLKINLESNKKKIISLFLPKNLKNDYDSIIENNYNNYNDLKNEYKNNIIEFLDAREYNNFTKEEKADAAEYILNTYWFQIERIAEKDVKQSYVIFTRNPYLNKDILDQDFVNLNRANIRKAHSIKTLNFPDRMFADTSLGVFRNNLDKKSINVKAIGDLTEGFIFNLMNITPQGKELLVQNYKAATEGLLSALKNVELKNIIDINVYNYVLEKTEKSIDAINNKTLLANSAVEKLMDSLNLIYISVLQSKAFFDDYVNSLQNFKNSLKNQEFTKEVNKKINFILRNKLTDDEIERLNINNIQDIYSNLNQLKAAFDIISSRSQYKNYSTKTSDQDIYNLVQSVLANKDKGNVTAEQMSYQDNVNAFNEIVSTKVLVFVDNPLANNITDDQFVITKKGRSNFTYYNIQRQKFSSDADRSNVEKKIEKAGGKIIKVINNEIIYYDEYGVTGTTKLISPDSNFKGTIANYSEEETKNLLNQIEIKNPSTFQKETINNLKGQIDLITSLKNIESKGYGPYINDLKTITYYNSNGNITTKGKDVAYYVIDIPMKNSQYGESQNQKLKQQRIGLLTSNKTMQNITGHFVNGGNTYKVNNIGTDEKPVFEVVVNNEINNILGNISQVLRTRDFQQANAKPNHDKFRIDVLRKFSKMSIDEYNVLVNSIVTEPENIEARIYNTIKKYFGTEEKLYEDINNSNDAYKGLYLAVFDSGLNEIFYNNKSGVIKTGDELPVIKGKGKGSFDRLITYKNFLSKIKTDIVGKDASIAASSYNSEKIAVKDTAYYPYAYYINDLIEIAKNLGLKFEHYGFSNLDAEMADRFGYAERMIGYNGSPVNNFKPLEPQQIKKVNYSIIENETKTNTKPSPQLTVHRGEGKIPMSEIDLSNYQSNKYKEFYIDGQGPRWRSYNNNNDEIQEAGELRYILWAASRGGKFKNNLERYFAGGYGYDFIKLNLMNKSLTSSKSNAIQLEMERSSDIVQLNKGYEYISKRKGSDKYYDLKVLREQEVNVPKYLFNIYNRNKSLITKSDPVIEKIPIDVLKPSSKIITIPEFEEQLNIVQKSKVGEDTEIALQEQSIKYKKYNDIIEGNSNMDKKFKYDPLTSSGIAQDDEIGFEVDNIIVGTKKDKMYNHYNLMKPIDTFYEIAVNLGKVNDVNQYMYYKGMLNYIEKLENDLVEMNKVQTTDTNFLLKVEEKKNDINVAKQKLGFNTIDDAKKVIENLRLYSGVLLDEADKLLNYISEKEYEALALNGSPVNNIYSILLPEIPEGMDKSLHRSFRSNLFKKDKEQRNIITYNFFETMMEYTKMIAIEQAYYNLGKRLRENGLMQNKDAVIYSQQLINSILDNAINDQNLRQKFAPNESIKTFLNSIPKSLQYFNYNGSLTNIFENKLRNVNYSEWLTAGYRTIDNLLQREGISYSEAETSLRLVENKTSPEFIKYDSILKAFEIRDQLITIIVKQYGGDLSFVFDAIKQDATNKGYVMVDRNGRIIPEKFEDYKMLSELNFEYLKKGLQYFSPYNGGYKNEVVLDMLNGDVFYMNKSLAEKLDKVEYNKPVPGKVIKALRAVGGITTQLLMSNPFQLISRVGKWTAGDLGFGMITDWKTPIKMPDAYKEIRAFLSSNGKVMSEDFRDWMKHYPIDPNNLDFNLLLNDIETAESTGKLFKNAYFDKTQKVGYWQSMFVRYAMFKAVKESFDKGKPNYGSSYYQKNLIDNLTAVRDSNGNIVQSANGRKAAYIVSQTLGSTLDFPELSKKANGVFVFTTYPLALVRWARNEASSLSTIVKDLFLESSGNKQDALRNLYVKGLGIAGIYAMLFLMYQSIGAFYDVDEEEKDEWFEEQATPEFIKTLFQGSPVMDKYNTINPLRQIQEKTLVPFQEGLAEGTGIVDGLAKGSLRFFLENFGNLNPAFKTTLEVLTGNDIIEREIIPATEYNNTFDNFYRKVAGFFVGNSGARALIKYKNDIAPYETDDTLLQKVLNGVTNVIDAEFGNTKKYKGDMKNYYNAKAIINGYKFDTQEIETITKPKLEETNYDIIKKEFRNAMSAETPMNKIYDIILSYSQAGVELKTIRAALRSLSLSETIENLENREAIFNNLNEKELNSIEKALMFENNVFPWLSYYTDALTNIINAEERSNRYYYPNYYNKQNYYNNYRPSFKNPYLNLYKNKVYLKDPFKAYQAAFWELNPDRKNPPEE